MSLCVKSRNSELLIDTKDHTWKVRNFDFIGDFYKSSTVVCDAKMWSNTLWKSNPRVYYQT